jgi:hypothetical protein
MRSLLGTGALVLAAATAARGTPNVPLEDPVYLQLAQLRAQGKLRAYLGGVRPLTEAEVQRLLGLGARIVATKTNRIQGVISETCTVMRDPEGNGFCVQ